MPRKITKKETGVYEKEPGSGVWWIRFKSNGVTRREKIGRRGDAIAAYKDRKTSILRGEKLPATMKNRGIRLREIGQDAIDWYIRTGKKDLRTFSQRMTAVMDSPLGAKGANDITHEDIDRWIKGSCRPGSSLHRAATRPPTQRHRRSVDTSAYERHGHRRCSQSTPRPLHTPQRWLRCRS
jgi:hypothetical protein